MRVIEASVELAHEVDGLEVMRRLERAGRVCYKSEGNITERSAEGFIRRLLERGHESVLEHESVTMHVVCDRGVSHEIVRHRLASYSQESTRYCNYASGKFNNEVTFIRPCFWRECERKYRQWLEAMSTAEKIYLEMLTSGASPEEARSVLPNSLKTELYMTMNLREWRHFLRLRTALSAHPQMREVALRIKEILMDKLPVVFADIV